MNSKDIYKLVEEFEKVASNPGSRLLSKVTNLFTDDYSTKMKLIDRLADLYSSLNNVETELTKTSDLSDFPKAYYSWVNFLTFFDINVLGLVGSEIKAHKGFVQEEGPKWVEPESLMDYKAQDEHIKLIIDNVKNQSFKKDLKSLNHLYRTNPNQQTFSTLLSGLNVALGTSDKNIDQLVGMLSFMQPEEEVEEKKDYQNEVRLLIRQVKDKDSKENLERLNALYKFDESDETFEDLIRGLNKAYGVNGYSIKELLRLPAPVKNVPVLEDVIIEEPQETVTEKRSIKQDLKLLKFLINNVQDKKVKAKLNALYSLYQDSGDEGYYEQLLYRLNDVFKQDDLSLNELIAAISSGEIEVTPSEPKKSEKKEIAILISQVDDKSERNKLTVLHKIYEANTDDYVKYLNLLDALNEAYGVSDFSVEQLLTLLPKELQPKFNGKELLGKVKLVTDYLDTQDAKNIYTIFKKQNDMNTYDTIIKELNKIFKVSDKSIDDLIKIIESSLDEPEKSTDSESQIPMTVQAKSELPRWLNRFKLNLFSNEAKEAKKDLAEMLNELYKKIDKLISRLESRKTTIASEMNTLKDIIYKITIISNKFIQIGNAYNSYAKNQYDEENKLVKSNKPIIELEFNRLRRANEKLRYLLWSA